MTTYFWQGGQQIPIEQVEGEITLHAADLDAAQDATIQAGAAVSNMRQISPDLVQATLTHDRDRSMEQLRQSGQVVHHVYRTPQQPDSEYLITDSFFIKFKPDTSRPSIYQYLQDEKLEIVEDLGQNLLLVRVTTATGRNPIRTSNLAATREDVEYAEPNLVRQLQRFAFIPTDELFAQQWHLHAPADSFELVAGADIHVAEAWDITRGSRDIVICVADDGFDITHPDFQGPNKIVGQLNALASNGNVFFTPDVMPKPGDYHGTPCAGVAVAEMNGQGTVGVAPECAFLPLRFPLSFDDGAMAKMFQRISREADIVSCSWGVGPANAPLSRGFYDVLSELAKTGGKRGKGLVICVAAGNNNCPVKDPNNTRTYQYNFGGILRSHSGPIDRWIAAHPDVITVSGSTSLKTRSAYSSWGRNITVCAPTDNWNDLTFVDLPGRGITTTDNEGAGQGSDFTPGSRFTPRFGGTSSATPTVAGVCGLILSANPNLSASDVKKILQNTADKDLKIESVTPVNEPGTFVDGFSLWFGYGKVNAAKAVKAAKPVATETTVDQPVSANMPIPDTSSPVFSKVDIGQAGAIADIRLSIDITHTYIGDLRVDVIAPDGTSVSLHDHVGGSQDNINKIYTPTDVPALRGLVGKSIQGTWSLRVVDTWRMDQGQLNSWRLVAKVNAA